MRGLLGEELPDRAPDVVLRAEVADTHRVALGLQLAEKLRELRLAGAEGRDAAGLDVSRVVEQPRELAERGARRFTVLGGVLAVRGIEEVGVVAARVVAALQHFEREAGDARADRATARGRLKELALVEFPGLRRMREEERLDLGVLAADALQREKEKLLGEAALRLVHAARDVEREHDRGVGRRQGAAVELAEAKVVVDDGERVVLHRMALGGFLERAPAVEARARAALVPAFADVVGLIQRRRALGLEVRELELLPQPVDDLIDLELDHEADFAVARAGLATLVVFFACGAQHVARLALALTGAGMRVGIEQAEARVLEELH